MRVPLLGALSLLLFLSHHAGAFSAQVSCTTIFHSYKNFDGLSFEFATDSFLWNGDPTYFNIWDFSQLKPSTGFDVEKNAPRSLTFSCNLTDVLGATDEAVLELISLHLYSFPLYKDNGGRMTNYKLSECTYNSTTRMTSCTSSFADLPGMDRTSSGAAMLFDFDFYLPGRGYRALIPDAPPDPPDGWPSPSPPSLSSPHFYVSPVRPSPLPPPHLFPLPPAVHFPPPLAVRSPQQYASPSSTLTPAVQFIPPPAVRSPQQYASSSDMLPSPRQYRFRPPSGSPPLDAVPQERRKKQKTPPPPATPHMPPMPTQFISPHTQSLPPMPALPPDLPGIPSGVCPPCVMPLEQFSLPNRIRKGSNPPAVVGSTADSMTRCMQGTPKPLYHYQACNAVHLVAEAGTPVFASEASFVLGGSEFPCGNTTARTCSLVLQTVALPGCSETKNIFYDNLDRSGLAVGAFDIVQRGQLLGYVARKGSSDKSTLTLAYEEPSESSLKRPCRFLYSCVFRSGSNCLTAPSGCIALTRC